MSFIGVVSVVVREKVRFMSASDGRKIANLREGLSVQECLDFYYSLAGKKDKKRPTIVTYASSQESEFMFSSLSPSLKDKIFKSYDYRNIVESLGLENERLFEELSSPSVEPVKKAENEALIAINKLLLEEVNQTETAGYRLGFASGKKLSLRRPNQNHVVTVYDIYGFFNKSLREAYAEWCGLDIPMLDRHRWEMVKLSNSADTSMLELVMLKEAEAIANLATALSRKLSEGGIKVRSYHGATAVTSAVLSKSKAKDEYHNYAYRRQYPPMMWQAVNQSFFGGRIEQVKLGTMDDIKVYDINSAYASASLLLPRLLKLPKYTSTFEDNPFSIWRVEWEDRDCYLPVLPVRLPSGKIVYPSRGSGYYWYPEVNHALKAMKNVRVSHGYVFDYIPAKFTESIYDLYQFRQKLKREGHPLEKVIKLALASLYGKFCETNGKGTYYNLFYAGFITAFTRARMMEAVQGREGATICFLTDAIHTLADLDVDVSDQIGSFSVKRYDRGTYCDIGVYGLQRDGELVKTATMGYANADFDAMSGEFAEKKIYHGNLDMFIGHNLHSLAPMKFKKYLQVSTEERVNSPLEQGSRVFVGIDGIDLTEDFCDSEPRVGIAVDSKTYAPNAKRDISMAKEMARAIR